MQIPTTLQLWLRVQAIPLAVIALLLVAGILVLQISAARRRSIRLRERAGQTEDGFVYNLSNIGFDPRIARTTYRFLQDEQNIRYPIHLQDALDEDFGMDSADVQEAVVALLLANHRSLLPGLLEGPILSVEDLIRFIHASPRNDQKAA